VTDETSKLYKWQIALRDLTHETDPEKITEQVLKVQGLIFERFQQLDNETDSEAERHALKEALTIVRIIMGDRPEAREENESPE
jgi:hypothetical protein